MRDTIVTPELLQRISQVRDVQGVDLEKNLRSAGCSLHPRGPAPAWEMCALLSMYRLSM